jgi:hypothetical protein
MMIYTVQAKIPEELLERLQEIAFKAEQAAGMPISIEAVILATISNGIGAVEYEVNNLTNPEPEKPRLRLVK